MNGKSKKKLMKIQLKRFREKQIDWHTITKILNWTTENKFYKPDDEFHISVSLSHIIDK